MLPRATPAMWSRGFKTHLPTSKFFTNSQEEQQIISQKFLLVFHSRQQKVGAAFTNEREGLTAVSLTTSPSCFPLATTKGGNSFHKRNELKVVSLP